MHGLFKSANTCMQPNTVSAQSGSTDACNQITLVAYIWPGQMQPGCLELAWLDWEGYQTRPKGLVRRPGAAQHAHYAIIYKRVSYAHVIFTSHTYILAVELETFFHCDLE